jgi:hypothetical protein
VSYSRAHSKR